MSATARKCVMCGYPLGNCVLCGAAGRNCLVCKNRFSHSPSKGRNAQLDSFAQLYGGTGLLPRVLLLLLIIAIAVLSAL